MARRRPDGGSSLALLVAALLCAFFAPGAAADGVIEWTWHKSADGAHPDGREQELLWLMNRARQDPAAEGRFLDAIDDPLIQSRLNGFGMDRNRLRAEFAAIPPQPPAAFDARLHAAALAHSLDMIARDRQDHQGQSDRVAAAGFCTRRHRGNAYAFSAYAREGHAAFNVDWGGDDGTGMQTKRPHRQAIMSADEDLVSLDLTNVGLAVVPETNRRSNVGPFVLTGNYEQADEACEDHSNRFLVGTVWTDLDGNGRYDDGEGIEGVTVLPSRGPFYAVTAAGGGYAIPAPAPGTVEIEFSGGGVPAHARSVAIGPTSVLVDYAVSQPLAAVPEPGATAQALAAGAALAAILRRRRARSDATARRDDGDAHAEQRHRAGLRDRGRAQPAELEIE